MINNLTVTDAREFALKAHGDQKYGEHPYIFHLDAVVNILDRYAPDVRIIGYLHDVLEDTKKTEDDIKKEFGEFIAKCVYFVTDESGHNRQIRKIKTYKKLKFIPAEYEKALIVKAADRLTNIESCIIEGRISLLKMYMKESYAFKDAVYRKGLCDDIWQSIEFIIQKTNIIEYH
jgi:(p)ppGpp synthase/HD superfamily hydrolase